MTVFPMKNGGLVNKSHRINKWLDKYYPIQNEQLCIENDVRVHLENLRRACDCYDTAYLIYRRLPANAQAHIVAMEASNVAFFKEKIKDLMIEINRGIKALKSLKD